MLEAQHTGLGAFWNLQPGWGFTDSPEYDPNDPNNYPDPTLGPVTPYATSESYSAKPTRVPTVSVPQSSGSIMNWIVGGGVIVMSFVAFKIYQNMKRKRG